MEWPSTGWTAGRNVERMLTFLWLQGRIMVAGRSAGQRLWGLPDTCLPADADRVALPPREMVTTTTEHTLRALGVARPLDIKQYFLRGKYPGLADVLRTLTQEGGVVPVKVEGEPPRPRPGTCTPTPCPNWTRSARATGRGGPRCCRRSTI